MIKINIDEEVIDVKDYMSVAQYQKFIRNEKLYKENPAELLSLWLEIPMNTIKDLPLEEVKFVENYLTQEITKEFNEDKLYETFEFEDVEYGLENDWSKLAWGAWVDFQVLCGDNVQENIHRIMAILYRPISEPRNKKGKYKIKPYKASEIEDRAEIFRRLPVHYWFGAANFFFLTSIIYTNNIQNSLKLTMEINQKAMKGYKILPKWIKRNLSTDFILPLHFNWQKKILPGLSKWMK